MPFKVLEELQDLIDDSELPLEQQLIELDECVSF